MGYLSEYLKFKKADPADHLFHLLCGTISSLILIADLFTPQGIAGGVPYVTVVLVSLWSPRRFFTLFVAACCSLLTLIGFLYSPDGASFEQEVFNRFLALFTIWATAFLTLMRKHDVYKREIAVAEKEKALEEVRVLRGFLPICSSCKKIRDDDGDWHHIEDYIITHSEADFSHGLCPKCSKSMYPHLFN